MTAEVAPAAIGGPGLRLVRLMRAHATAPAWLFVWLSLLFGLPLIAATPPLRGADEPAHFLRAYGIAAGELVPATRIEGRVGIALPPDLHAGFSVFENARYRFAEGHLPYGEAFAEYRRLGNGPAAGEPVFVPYQGSEAYTPVAYLPYTAVTLIGRALGSDFLSMLYAMRLIGLLLWTAIIAAAIALAPGLRWALLLIALLPSAQFGRAMVSADGAATALAILVAALALRAGALGAPWHRLGERIAWTTLCILVKPSQLALAPLELLATRRKVGSWLASAAVVLPGALLTGLWVYLTGAEVAIWRLTDSGLPAEQFAIGWKLAYIAEQPGRFVNLLVVSAWQQAPELYKQMIGVLGWLDTPLRGWTYPLLGVALLLAMANRLDWPKSERRRALAIAGLTAIGYVAFVYFLFYVTWTPVDAEEIWGIQGRYLVPILPAVAIAAAAALPVRHGVALAAPAAIAGSLLAGSAAIEAVWQANW